MLVRTCRLRLIKSVIREMNSQQVMKLATSAAAAALSASELSLEDCYFLVCVTGITVSADLWRHPSAVRYLLLPAIREIRKRDKTFIFSLETKNNTINQIIEENLKSKWNDVNRNAW